MTQDDIFLNGEGDRWFERNAAVLGGAVRIDWPFTLLDMLGDLSFVRSVAEFGCCNGYRLAALGKRLGDGVRFVGIDASARAIQEGRERFPNLDLRCGILSDTPIDEPVDLAIVNFVLHWIDRSMLSSTIATIDRSLADGGLLVVGDFLPDAPSRRPYHHLPKDDVWTYKQDYARIFEAMGSYRELLRVTFDHDTGRLTPSGCTSDARGMCSVLAKSLTAYYREA